MAEVPTIDVLDKDGVPRTIATDTKVLQTLGLPTDAADTNPASPSTTQIAVEKGILSAIQSATQAPGSAPPNQCMAIINPTTQGVAVSQDTSKIADGAHGTMLTPVNLLFDVNTSGAANVVLAAQGAGIKIRVVKWFSGVDGAVNFKWQSNQTTDITKLIRAQGAGPAAGENFCPTGHFTTAANESLTLNLSAAQRVEGHLQYVLVT